jgi:GTP-binding protein
MADIPGLIEGAAEGKGLGDKFLRHIERTKVVVHVVDLAGVDGRDPMDDFKSINHELKAYQHKLEKKPQIVVLNKIDLTEAKENLPTVKKALAKKKIKPFVISTATGEGLEELKKEIAKTLQKNLD